MSSKFYFQNAAAPYTPATVRGAWDVPGTALTGKLGTVPAGAAATQALAETNATNNWDVLSGRWISDGLPNDVSISGQISWIIGWAENNAAANAHAHLHIFVTQGDSDLVRGTLFTDFIGTNEFVTTAQGEGDGNQNLTTVAALKGDRIVVEVGFQNQNTSVSSLGATMNYGNTGGTDLTQSDTNVTTKPGWIQFSHTIFALQAAAGGITPTGALKTSVTKFLTGVLTMSGDLFSRWITPLFLRVWKPKRMIESPEITQGTAVTIGGASVTPYLLKSPPSGRHIETG